MLRLARRTRLLVPLLLLLLLLSACARRPLFPPDPFQHELIRDYAQATGYYAERVGADLVCIAPSESLCRCGTTGLEGAVAGLPLSRRLELNSATRADLERLPGIGPGLAGRILARREEAPFTAPEDLLDVPGIGPGRYARLAPLVWVGPAGTPKGEGQRVTP